MDSPTYDSEQLNLVTEKESIQIQANSQVALLPKSSVWSPDRQRFMMIFHFVGSVLVYASRTAMPLCLPSMNDEFGWDKKEQGLILSCFLWGYPVTQILGGYMSDKIGAERVILLSAAGWSVMTFFTPYFPLLASDDPHYALLAVLLARLSQGLLQGVHYPAVMSMISRRVVEKERNSVFGTIGAGCHGGTLFTGLVGSYILHNLGWPAVFNILGLLGLVWTYMLYCYGDINVSHVISIKENLVKDPESGSFSKAQTKVPWNKILVQPPFWAMMAAHFAQGYTFFVFLFWMPSFFHENYPQAQPWLYNVLPWIIDMCLSISSGSIADLMLNLGYSKTFTRKSLNIFGELGFGLCLILISYADSYEHVLLCICLAAAGHGFYQSTVLMNPSDITPNHAGYMFAIPGFIGTYTSGAILEATHNWTLMYAVTGWVSVVGWSIFHYWGSGEPIL